MPRLILDSVYEGRVWATWNRVGRRDEMPDPEEHPRSTAGILAYGSLIGDPGVELGPLIFRRMDTLTPFPVAIEDIHQHCQQIAT